MVPSGTSADHFRKVTLEHFDMSLGSGLSKVADKVFRIGHLGDFNDLMLMGTLSAWRWGSSCPAFPTAAVGCKRPSAISAARTRLWRRVPPNSESTETGSAWSGKECVSRCR